MKAAGDEPHSKDDDRAPSEEAERAAIRWEQTPWETLRGVWASDFNRFMVLVRPPLENVARALEKQGYCWQRDVLGQQVVIAKWALLVYRLRNHPWTVVVSEAYCVPFDLGRALSAELKAAVIYDHLGKTAGVRGYTLYQDGEEQECFQDLADEGMHFTSKLRNVRAETIHDSSRFIDDFFRTQDALDSGITFEYFLRSGFQYRGTWAAGERKTIQNLGLPAQLLGGRLAITRPPIERVDLLSPPDQQPDSPGRRNA